MQLDTNCESLNKYRLYIKADGYQNIALSHASSEISADQKSLKQKINR